VARVAWRLGDATLGQSTLPGLGLMASSWHAPSIRLNRLLDETQRARIADASGTQPGPTVLMPSATLVRHTTARPCSATAWNQEGRR
jgi:hypothetical protein